MERQPRLVAAAVLLVLVFVLPKVETPLWVALSVGMIIGMLVGLSPRSWP